MAEYGKPVSGIRIIDAHTHMGRWGNFHIPRPEALDMIDSMDRLGIEACISSHHAAISADCPHGNDSVLKAARQYEKRVYGYVGVNPNLQKQARQQLDYYLSGHPKHFIGIKLHHDMHNVSIDHPLNDIAYEKAVQYSVPVLLHVWGDADVAAVLRTAKRYPAMKILMGHGGGTIRSMERAIEAVHSVENIFLDTAWSMSPEGNIEWLCGNVGSDRMVFGTDMPFFSPQIAFGRVVHARIKDNEKENILGRTIIRLLDGRI